MGKGTRQQELRRRRQRRLKRQKQRAQRLHKLLEQTRTRKERLRAIQELNAGEPDQQAAPTGAE